MSSPNRSRFGRPLPLSASLIAHGLVAALFVTVGVHLKPKLTQPAAKEYQIAMVEVAGGSALARVPLIMAPNADRNAEKPRIESPANTKAEPEKRRPAKATGSNSLAAREQDRGTSSAAGNGSDARNATFAFPTYSPKPPVSDRSLLPTSDRQVVVDVKLNAAGEVIDETLVASLGNALDQLVLTAVKTWRFQPATVDGQPVASEAEVIFTFGPHYPVAGA